MTRGQLPPSLPCELDSDPPSIAVAGVWIFLTLYNEQDYSGMELRRWIRLVAHKYMRILPLLCFLFFTIIGITP